MVLIRGIKLTFIPRFSEIYDERVETYKREKKKTEKLLTDLLPRQVIHQMKKGKIPEPESFNSVSIFLCDIVGFTSLASESTAHQVLYQRPFSKSQKSTVYLKPGSKTHLMRGALRGERREPDNVAEED